ncbi:MAG: hypothetical protein AAF152_07595 [Cyanobacteria bacterium P01_A01_bin.114]
MNAAEKAFSIEFASKIAAIVGLFKGQLPDLRADLKPWINDPDVQDLVDPDSIDIGFHFPGVSRAFRCRSLLVQIRFHREGGESSSRHVRRAIGVEIAGFDHSGQQWRLSTIHDWQFEGKTVPETDAGDQLKDCCRQIFDIFNAE